jgi:hypothetical protein
LVKDDERGGQSHTVTSLLHVSGAWHGTVNTHHFYTNAFSTLCFILYAADGKIKPCACMKLSKFAAETLKMLHEAFREHSLCCVRFEVFTAVTMKNGVTSQKTPFFILYAIQIF